MIASGVVVCTRVNGAGTDSSRAPSEGMLMLFGWEVGYAAQRSVRCPDVKFCCSIVHRHKARRSRFRCRQVAVNAGQTRGIQGKAEDRTETGKLSHSREIGAKSASLLGFWFWPSSSSSPVHPARPLGRNPEGFRVFGPPIRVAHWVLSQQMSQFV